MDPEIETNNGASGDFHEFVTGAFEVWGQLSLTHPSWRSRVKALYVIIYDSLYNLLYAMYTY